MAAAAVKGLSGESRDELSDSPKDKVEAGAPSETDISVLAKIADTEGEIMLLREWGTPLRTTQRRSSLTGWDGD